MDADRWRSVLFAHRSPGALRSIEELFATIAGALGDEWVVREARAPAVRATPAALLRNLIWAGSMPRAAVVHQTGDLHYAVLGVWRCPVVLTIHDVRFIEEAQGFRRWLFRWFWLELPCRRANAVTVISEFTRQRLLGACRVDPAKVRVIPNCVAPEFVPTGRPWPVGTVRILLVGTTPNKNLEKVAAACSGLDVSLSILGRLNDAQRILVDRSGLSFEEHSGLSRAEVVGLYQSCDLVCFVSTYEGFGMPILEAQATGRPVLTSNIPPMCDVAGRGALLVDPFDEGAIRDGLERLLGDAGLRARLVEAGFGNVSRYSATAVAARYVEVYREVMGEK